MPDSTTGEVVNQFPLPCENVRRKSFLEIWQTSAQLAEVRSNRGKDLSTCSSCSHLGTCIRALAESRCTAQRTRFLHRGERHARSQPPVSPEIERCVGRCLLRPMDAGSTPETRCASECR